jgi:hypothetical protein
MGPFYPKEKILNLKWLNPEPVTTVNQIGEEIKITTIILGNFIRPEWTLVANNKKIITDEKGNFEFKMPLTVTALSTEFTAIGPMGEIEKETLRILYTDWELRHEEIEVEPKKKYFINPGLNLTTIQYKETGTSDYNSISLTGKFSITYLLRPPKWDLGMSAYLTLIPVTKSRKETARFFGYNLRAGYTFPKINKPWKFTLYGGIYYTTMFVNPAAFGFKNMSGIQIFPTLRKTLKNDSAISGYFKYSPISQNFGLLSLDNRELALGLAYTRPMPGEGKTLNFSFDLSNIAMKLIGTVVGTTKQKTISITNTTLSIGSSYGF